MLELTLGGPRWRAGVWGRLHEAVLHQLEDAGL